MQVGGCGLGVLGLPIPAAVYGSATGGGVTAYLGGEPGGGDGAAGDSIGGDAFGQEEAGVYAGVGAGDHGYGVVVPADAGEGEVMEDEEAFQEVREAGVAGAGVLVTVAFFGLQGFEFLLDLGYAEDGGFQGLTFGGGEGAGGEEGFKGGFGGFGGFGFVGCHLMIMASHLRLQLANLQAIVPAPTFTRRVSHGEPERLRELTTEKAMMNAARWWTAKRSRVGLGRGWSGGGIGHESQAHLKGREANQATHHSPSRVWSGSEMMYPGGGV